MGTKVFNMVYGKREIQIVFSERGGESMRMKDSKDILIVCQVFPPDPASGGHLYDVATEMGSRGYHVGVLTSREGYNDPKKKYPIHEQIGNIEIIRIPNTSFGKDTIFSRIRGHISFIIKSIYYISVKIKFKTLLFTTAPPSSSLIGSFVAIVLRKPVCFWVMDINPDQAIALGVFKKESLSVRILEFFNKVALRNAKYVVTLDRYMLATLKKKAVIKGHMEIIPPWPHIQLKEFIPKNESAFAKNNGLVDRFVVMYSGNHSPVNPLDTLLRIAENLKDEENIVFVFVGGGTEKGKVERLAASGKANIITFPYQPFDKLADLLSAADLHVAVIGDTMTGIVHTSKIYGALGVGRPVLTIGPERSHLAEIVKKNGVGFHIRHGDVELGSKIIHDLALSSKEERAIFQKNAKQTIEMYYSKSKLCGKLCNFLEEMVKKMD